MGFFNSKPHTHNYPSIHDEQLTTERGKNCQTIATKKWRIAYLTRFPVEHFALGTVVDGALPEGVAVLVLLAVALLPHVADLSKLATITTAKILFDSTVTKHN